MRGRDNRMSATAALIDWPLEAEDDTPLALWSG
jgi:UDP-N-acetylmuramoyl-tripeptide--D-alanyl-D-alanine ligase